MNKQTQMRFGSIYNDHCVLFALNITIMYGTIYNFYLVNIMLHIWGFIHLIQAHVTV